MTIQESGETCRSCCQDGRSGREHPSRLGDGRGPHPERDLAACDRANARDRATARDQEATVLDRPDPGCDRPVAAACDQSRAPLLQALLGYAAENTVRLHMPGHKGRPPASGAFGGDPDDLARLVGEKVFLADVTELPGLDDLHAPEGPIKEAQRLAASAYGADASFFLVNGSTCGVHAMIMASCGAGDEIIVPRDAHRAVIGGLVLSGARPVYVAYDVDELFGVPLGPTPESLRSLLEAQPHARAVMLTNPNYYGVAPNIKTLVAMAHDYGKIALVDEAHGAHLPFHEELPPSALEAGADAVVSGAHKVLPAMTQASLLHLKGSRIDREAVSRALRLVETTSPSYVLMASIDAARRIAATRGRELLDRVIRLAGEARERLGKLPGVKCLHERDLAPRGFGHDPTKLLISFSGLGMSGFEAAGILRRDHGVQVELADGRNVLAILTILDTEDDVMAFVRAVEAIARDRRGRGREAGPGPTREAAACLSFVLRNAPPLEMTPREAAFSPIDWVDLDQAAGRIASDAVVPYPPGIPLVWPGEEITPAVAEFARRALASGVELQGVSGGRVPVVARRART